MKNIRDMINNRNSQWEIESVLVGMSEMENMQKRAIHKK